MALIKCPECGNDVSDKAEFCPNCGYTIQDIVGTPDGEDGHGKEISTPADPLKKKKTLPIIVVCVIVAVVAAGIISSTIKPIEKRADEALQGTWEAHVGGKIDSNIQLVFNNGNLQSRFIIEGLEDDPLVNDGKYEVTKDKIILKYGGDTDDSEYDYSFENGEFKTELLKDYKKISN